MFRTSIHLLLLLVPALLHAQTAPATRPARPNAGARAAALELVKATYKADYAKTAPADRAALARKLLQDGLATRDSLDARYVMLEQAAEIAAAGGDGATVVAACDALAREFSGVDALEHETRLLARANTPRGTAKSHEALALIAVEQTYVALEADRYDLAEQLAAVANAAAEKARRVPVITTVEAKLARYKEVLAAYRRVASAIEKLRREPEDSEANLAVGRFYGFVKDDWSAALPRLAKGNDAALKTLAERDMLHPTDAVLQVTLADGWWALAETLRGPARTAATRRACYWYAKALGDLKGLTHERVAGRIKLCEPGGVAPAPAKLDLLALIDTDKDVVEGEWKTDGKRLACERGAYARVQVPVIPPAEYDLNVTFIRTDGDGPVSLLLAAGGTSFGWTMDAAGHLARLERVDKKIKADNPTQTTLKLANERRYAVSVQVRKDVVKVLLDGKALVEHQTDFADLSPHPKWKLTDPRRLGLGASKAKVVFLAVELVTVTGEANKLRGGT